MDRNAVLSEVETWAPEDRLRLIEAVRNGLSDITPKPSLNDELKALLTRRLAALEANPDAVLTWQEIKAYVRHPR